MYNNSIRNFIFLAPLEIISKIITTNICIPQKPPGDVCTIGLERERVRADFLPYFFPPFRDDSVRLYHHQNRLAVVAGCLCSSSFLFLFFVGSMCHWWPCFSVSSLRLANDSPEWENPYVWTCVCVSVSVSLSALNGWGSYRNTTHKKRNRNGFFFALTNEHIFFFGGGG
jgi:hypothetical protein